MNNKILNPFAPRGRVCLTISSHPRPFFLGIFSPGRFFILLKTILPDVAGIRHRHSHSVAIQCRLVQSWSIVRATKNGSKAMGSLGSEAPRMRYQLSEGLCRPAPVTPLTQSVLRRDGPSPCRIPTASPSAPIGPRISASPGKPKWPMGNLILPH